MTCVLRLECIGDDVFDASRRIARMPPHAQREFRRRHRRAEWVPVTPSVVDLFGRIAPFQKDYSAARGRGARGIFKIYLLADGVYRVTAVVAPMVTRRFCILVSGTEWQELPDKEAARWASSAT